MNAIALHTASPLAPAAVIPPARREIRSRDFGVGYGSSSGYFSRRRYAGNAFAPRFRFN